MLFAATHRFQLIAVGQTLIPLPGCFPGSEAAGREVNRTPPPSSEVKNDWNDTSARPPYAFMAWTWKN